MAIVTAASIMAEIQDIGNFSAEAQLASYSGLALKRFQTGKTANFRTPQGRCNRRLKRYMLHLAMQSAMFDPRSKAFYQKKLGEGKKPLRPAELWPGT